VEEDSEDCLDRASVMPDGQRTRQPRMSAALSLPLPISPHLHLSLSLALYFRIASAAGRPGAGHTVAPT
jgi:hypothetical protein